MRSNEMDRRRFLPRRRASGDMIHIEGIVRWFILTCYRSHAQLHLMLTNLCELTLSKGFVLGSEILAKS